MPDYAFINRSKHVVRFGQYKVGYCLEIHLLLTVCLSTHPIIILSPPLLLDVAISLTCRTYSLFPHPTCVKSYHNDIDFITEHENKVTALS